MGADAENKVDTNTVTELKARIAALEKEGRFRFYVQVLLAPVVLTIFGFVFTQQIERQKSDLQTVEREAKRAEAITAAMPYLSTGPSQRALLQQSVLSTIVSDAEVRNKISVVVAQVVKTERDAVVANLLTSNLASSTQKLESTQEIAKKLETAPADVNNYYNKTTFYVVVESEKDEAIAVRSAQAQPGAEVWKTTNPYFAVTLSKKSSFDEARRSGAEILAKGAAREFFVLSDDYLVRRVYPKSSNASPE
jgi:hypothetical protein